MKTFQQFQEQLPSNYTDYKAPGVQAAHARSMIDASKMRQVGVNAISIDPKDQARDNITGEGGVAKPLPGTIMRTGMGKGKRISGGGFDVYPSGTGPFQTPTK